MAKVSDSLAAIRQSMFFEFMQDKLVKLEQMIFNSKDPLLRIKCLE